MAKAGYLKVETARHGPVCALTVTGELDMFTVADFAESAAVALKIPAQRFVLDLSRLSFTDCCGARTLATMTRAVPAGCPVIVRSVSPAVRRVMDLMGVNLELRTMVPGDRAARVLLESQRIRSLTQHAMAESRMLAETLAATEDRVADTLTQLADRRPHRAGRLAALSHTARTQAAHFRGQGQGPGAPLAMVFIIQHTQARHQRATQRKLDEILLATPGADNSLLTLEHASDEQLRDAGHQHRQVRQAALDDGSAPAAGRSAQVDPAQRRP